MGNGNKSKYLGLAGLGVIAAATVAYFSTLWPPASHDAVQGAVGKREVYRDPQLTDKDVGVAGNGSVTIDDLKKVVQSEAFRTLANDARFSSLVAGGQVAALTGNAALFKNQHFQNVLLNPNFAAAAQNANFANMVADQKFVSAIEAGGGQQLEKVLQQYELSGNQQVTQLVQNANFQNVVSQMQQMGTLPQLLPLIANVDARVVLASSSFGALLAMPGVGAALSNHKVVELASQGQLASLSGNAALQTATFNNAAGISH